MAIFTGTTGNDTLTGGADDDLIEGFAGDDSLNGLGGDDVLIGGTGDDTLNGGDNGLFGDFVNYDSATNGVNVDLTAGTAADGEGGNDTLLNIEHIQGSAQADVLKGNGNTNWFRPGAGDDTVDGAGGQDVVFYESASSGVTIDLGAGIATGASIGSDSLTSIENAHGSYHDDVITLSNAGGYVFGRAGNDLLTGASAGDLFIGGSGADTLNGGGGFDKASYVSDGFDGLADPGNGVSVNLATGVAIDNWGHNDTLISIENVDGSDFDDTLTGDANNNFLNGNSGSDTLDGGDGSDTLAGGSATDNSADALFGGNGDDVLRQTQGADTLDGGAGFDRIDFTQTGITYGGATGVTVNLATHVADLNSNAAGTDSTLTSIEIVFGTAGNDAFTGGDPLNVIDSLGNRNSERFRPGAGNDTITGGADIGLTTIVDYANNTSAQAVSVNLFTGVANDGLGGTDTFVKVDRAHGGAGDDLLVGGSPNNRSIQGTFFEILRGNAGDDTLDGGDAQSGAIGNDRADYSNNSSNQPINVNLATGIAADGLGGTDTLIDIQQVFGGSGIDTFTGGAADDIFDGGAGNDILDGAGGFDQARFQQSPAGVIVNLSAGPIVVGADTVAGGTARDGFGSTDTLVNIENVRGSDFADYIRGSDDSSIRETFDGDAGDDTIDGGAGLNFASYQSAAVALGGVNAFIENGSGTVTDPAGGSDTLINIEGLTGTNSNDTLTGGLGDQWFRGRAGSDLIDGGAGNDWVTYSTDPAGVTVNLSLGTATDGWNGQGGLLDLGGTDTLDSIENAEGSDFDDHLIGDANPNQLDGGEGNDSLEGLGGDDTLIGGAGNDTLDGGSGVDSMAGGTGNDTFIVDEVLDIVVENTGEGTDTVITSVSIVLPDHVEILQFVGNGGVITGNAQDNVIAGSPFDDTIIGAGGNDTVSYEYETNPVTIDLFEGVATGSGTDVLAGFQNAEGGSADDTLIGNDNANVLDGGGGADSMQGGQGNDTYVVDTLDDVVTEVPNEVALALGLDAGARLDQAVLDGFIDTVIASVNYSLENVAFVENITLSGTASTATGNALDNVITGNALNNTFSGLGGNDTLDGGTGLDTALFSGNRADFAITYTEAGYSVSGQEGNDTLMSIERVHFADKKVALDLGAGEAAGNTVRIIGAAFDTPFITPQFVSIGLNLFDNANMSMVEVCELAIGTGLFQSLAGSSSNEAFVNLVFQNVVGVAPNDAQRALFVGMLQGSGGSMSQAELLQLAANHPLNALNINLVGLQDSGVEFA